MQFVNPIEILELQYIDIGAIDGNAIKKAKKRIFAEIELSDDSTLNYFGRKIMKSDCELAINELDDSNKKEFYWQLATSYKNLNNFLRDGNILLFDSFKQESIYKLTDFISFINPYFAHNFDNSLFKAFKNNNPTLVKSILRTQYLISPAFLNDGYKSLSIEIQNRISDIEKVKQEILDGTSKYTNSNIDTLLEFVKQRFPIEVLNSLPTYYQSQINKIASNINSLQLAIWDKYTNTQVCYELLLYLLRLNIESASKPTFEKNLEIVKRQLNLKIEYEKNAIILSKWNKLKDELESLEKRVEGKSINSKEALTSILAKLNVQELNALGAVAETVRNDIGLRLRSVSIACWNMQDDLTTAISILAVGLKLDLNQTLKAKLQEDNRTLVKLQEDYIKEITSRNTRVSYSPSPAPKSTADSYAGCIVIVVFFLFLLAIATCNHSSPPSVSTDNSAPANVSTPPAYVPPPPAYVPPPPVISPYKGKKLKNGDSPFDGYYGAGIYDQESTSEITFSNGYANDAVVLLYDIYNQRTIRNEYIRAGTSFSMSMLPSGTYELKIYGGNDWNPTLKSFCGTDGAFESDKHFSKCDDPKDYIHINNGSNHERYTSGSITLYAVSNGNMSTSPATESDFK